MAASLPSRLWTAGLRRSARPMVGAFRRASRTPLLSYATSSRVDPYEVLGLPRDATAEQIKDRYRELAKRYHPDRFGGDDTRFKDIQAAYERLSKAGFEQPSGTGPGWSWEQSPPFYASSSGGGSGQWSGNDFAQGFGQTKGWTIFRDRDGQTIMFTFGGAGPSGRGFPGSQQFHQSRGQQQGWSSSTSQNTWNPGSPSGPSEDFQKFAEALRSLHRRQLIARVGIIVFLVGLVVFPFWLLYWVLKLVFLFLGTLLGVAFGAGSKS